MTAANTRDSIKPIVIKIGGGQSINTEGIVRGLVNESKPKIIVLGANSIRDQIANALERPTKTLTSVSGYQSVYSDRDAIEMIMMTYAGLARGRFVEQCQKHHINAIGLSGLDARVIQGSRNRAIRVRENGKTLIKRDFSGKPDSVNTSFLTTLLQQGLTPVLSIPIADADGFAINADNDNIITVLHRKIGVSQVYQFIEAPGLLKNSKDPSSLIKSLKSSQLAHHEALVSARMKRKLLAIRQLFEAGPTKVVIADGRTESPFEDANLGRGTVIEV